MSDEEILTELKKLTAKQNSLIKEFIGEKTDEKEKLTQRIVKLEEENTRLNKLVKDLENKLAEQNKELDLLQTASNENSLFFKKDVVYTPNWSTLIYATVIKVTPVSRRPYNQKYPYILKLKINSSNNEYYKENQIIEIDASYFKYSFGFINTKFGKHLVNLCLKNQQPKTIKYSKKTLECEKAIMNQGKYYEVYYHMNEDKYYTREIKNFQIVNNNSGKTVYPKNSLCFLEEHNVKSLGKRIFLTEEEAIQKCNELNEQNKKED
jgi:hypothetical protein